MASLNDLLRGVLGGFTGTLNDRLKAALTGGANNTYYVGPGCEYTSVQDAVDAAAGTILGYKGCWLVGSAAVQADPTAVTTGSYITITAKGHPTDPDSAATYEFTAGEGATIDGAVEIDKTSPLDYGELLAAIVTAISTSQGQGVGGDTSMDAAIGSACYDGAVGLGAHDAAAWAYFDVTISHPDEWSVVSPYKKRSDATRKTVKVYTGTYTLTEPLQLPEGIDLIGVDPANCVITYPGTSNYPTVLMDNNTSIRGLTLRNTGASGFARIIWPNSPFYAVDDVTIEGNILEAANWCVETASWNAIDSLIYGITNLRVERNLLASSNPISMNVPHKNSRIVFNTLSFDGASTSCHAFMDDLTPGGADSACFAVIANNVGRIEVAEYAAAAYLFTVRGSGHRIIDNNIELVMPDHNAAIASVLGIQIAAESLWTGETAFFPIEISGNRFRTTYLGDAGDVAASTFLYSIGAARKADVILRDNEWTLNAPGTKAAIEFVGANANPTTITVLEGGLGSFDGSTVTLTDASVVNALRGSGAGLSHALLDTAFGAHNSVAVGRVFRYVDTSDSNKEYLVWSDGTNWCHSAAATKLAHA